MKHIYILYGLYPTYTKIYIYILYTLTHPLTYTHIHAYIGEASYDRVVVASEMCNLINTLTKSHKTYVNMRKLNERYNLPFTSLTGNVCYYCVFMHVYMYGILI